MTGKKDFIKLLQGKKQGDNLSQKEAKILADLIVGLVEFAASGHTQQPRDVYSHYTLQSTIGRILETLGCEVAYEVPFQLEGWDNRRVVFDVVAEYGNEVNVIEIKDYITPRDLGQVYGYADILQLGKEKTKVYLGTDALNIGDCVEGVTGEMIKELMEREKLGLILADKFFLLVFDNYQQLIGAEMPSLIDISEDEE